jgi:hypothetical protein
MGWATFWAIFSLAHLVTMVGREKKNRIGKHRIGEPGLAAMNWISKVVGSTPVDVKVCHGSSFYKHTTYIRVYDVHTNVV